MTDDATLVKKEFILPWDTEIFNLTIAAGSDGLTVSTSSTAIGYSNNDDESIAVPWSEVLKHAPTDALVAALRERPGVTVDHIKDGERFVFNGPEDMGPAILIQIVPRADR